MHDTASSEPGLSPAWVLILEKIDQALCQALAAVTEQERPLATESRAPASEHRAVWQACLEACGSRLRQLQSSVTQAEEDAAEADCALGTASQAFREWLTAVAGAQQRLAEEAGHQVR